MKRTPAGFLSLTLLLAILSAPTLAAQNRYDVVDELGVPVPMRDGVELVADIYRPASTEESFPVLLQRTPYNRKNGAQEGRQVAAHGYIVVIQDTRGRYDSPGEFYTFRHETADGYDTVEWAARLPHSDGQVGMYGGSYVGATQMLAAIGKPPHLVAVFPYVTASEYYEGWTYQGGALEQWFTESWTSGLAQDTLSHKVAALANPREWSYGLPVDQFPILELPKMDDVAPYFDDWVRHETDDAYWKPWKISDHYSELTVKGLHGGGWHDIFLKGTIKNYMGLRDHAATPQARASQRLLIGPWAHAATSPAGKIGDVVFGKQAVLDMPATIAAWSDWALKGVQNEFADDTPVRIFVMGANVWRDEKEFPLERQQLTRYFLHSEEGANGLAGDGALATSAPVSEDPDVFQYDPTNPVPTIGGRLCCGNNQLPPGPFDQSPNETRQDVLVFSTPPLERDLEVTGLIQLDLYASTTAADTDFTALLVDVDPSGYARFLTDGIIRARYRNSTASADPITPGEIVRYEIDLWATSNVFLKGHRVRLYVSSSNFPRFNRNLNTGQPILGSTGWVTAQQTIYHDADHPSALVLPVIP